MNDIVDLINGAKLTLVDFFAEWCGPCRMQGPIIDSVRTSMGDTVEVVKVDVDRHQDLATLYGVRSIPTLILFRSGRVLWRATGVQSYEDISSVILKFAGSEI